MESALSHVSFQVAGGWLFAGTVAFGLLVLAAFSARNLTVSGRRRTTLVLLRWTTALALALLVAQPSWQVEQTRLEAGRVAVVFDDSASLGWGKPGERRIDQAQKLLQRWSEAADGSHVRFYRLAEELVPLTPDAGDSDGERRLSATGAQSRLFEGLQKLANDAWTPSSIVLVSDGADSSSEPMPRGLGVPVHTVGFEDDPPLRDDAVVAVEPDARVYLHTDARVLVRVQSTGLGARDLRVRLERGGQVVDERSVRVEEDDRAHVELTFMPRDLGRESYVVRIEPDARDMVPQNDSVPFVVDVVRERLRVLHVAGAPSWDQRFLRGFLKRDPALDLISFFILRSTHDMTMSDSSELALIPFPTDELFREHLDSFDVVILQNFNYGPYRMARYLPLIRDYVRKGGALAMIGGRLSFDGGGYSNTPIAEVLPVKLLPPGGSAKVVTGYFAPKRVPSHENHPLLDLHPDPEAGARAWAGLAKLQGANQFAGLSSHGVVLWQHPTARVEGAPMPVLAVGEFGRGRTLALGTDSVWRWTVPTAGRGGDPTVYDRFWDRALRWLSRDPALAPSQLTTDAERYARGARVQVQALVRAPDYRPVESATLTVRPLGAVEGAPLVEQDLRTDPRGRATASFEAPGTTGAYVVEVQGEGVAEASEPFLVTEGGAELADPRVHPEVLRTLAEGTAAKYYAEPEDAPDLSELLVPTRVRAGIDRYAPFSTVWAGLFAVALFCLEWWLRRAWGER